MSPGSHVNIREKHVLVYHTMAIDYVLFQDTSLIIGFLINAQLQIESNSIMVIPRISHPATFFRTVFDLNPSIGFRSCHHFPHFQSWSEGKKFTVTLNCNNVYSQLLGKCNIG